MDDDREDQEGQKIAGRMGGAGEEAARPYDRPPTPAPTPGTSAMGESAQAGGSVIEKTASVNMRTFERRFEDELGGEELTLAAAFDVPGETKMRMFVVAPKDLGTSTSTPTDIGGAGGTTPPPGGGAMGGGSPTPEGGGMGGAAAPAPEGGAMGGAGMPPSEPGAMGDTPPPSDAAGGTTPRPQPGTMPGGAAGSGDTPPSGSAMGGQASSKEAQSALQKARLVVAYSDESRPEEVTIAYMKPSQAAMGGEQPDEKLHAAIDRIVGEGMDAPPPKPDEERRG